MKQFIESVQKNALSLNKEGLNSTKRDLEGCLNQSRLGLNEAKKKLEVVKILNNANYAEICLDGYEATINAHNKRIDDINKLIATINDLMKTL